MSDDDSHSDESPPLVFARNTGLMPWRGFGNSEIRISTNLIQYSHVCTSRPYFNLR
jgi:hypothetical protein